MVLPMAAGTALALAPNAHRPSRTSHRVRPEAAAVGRSWRAEYQRPFGTEGPTFSESVLDRFEQHLKTLDGGGCTQLSHCAAIPLQTPSGFSPPSLLSPCGSGERG